MNSTAQHCATTEKLLEAWRASNPHLVRTWNGAIARPTVTDPGRFHRTSTGIVIGGHHIPRPPVLSADAEAVQRAMLARERNTRADRITVTACVLGMALLSVAYIVWGG